jgi:uncharacterized protein (TIGR03067 family)
VRAAFLLLAGFAGCSDKPPGGAPAAPADAERLQGVWAVESVEAGDPKLKLPDDVDRTKIRMQFRGDRIAGGVAGNLFETGSFVLDESANPRVMSVTPLEGGQPVRPQPGSPFQVFPRDHLYKFDGETLVIAVPQVAIFTEKPPERPTDFAPRLDENGRAKVIVMRLVRTDEAVVEAPPSPARSTKK